MILPDLPSPAEASNASAKRLPSFAQAGNRYPLFGIVYLAMLAPNDVVMGDAAAPVV